MTIFGRLFQPAWWSIGLTLLGVALFCSLGVWQLQRADYKSGIMTLYQQRLAEDYRTTSVGALRAEDQRYRKVELEGSFDLQKQLLVDNRLHQGRAGYHVLTPWVSSDGRSRLLVNRGWVPLGASRDTLPVLQEPLVNSVIRGIVTVPDASGFQLGEVKLGDQWPQVIPFVDMNALREQFPLELEPFVLWMAPEAPGSYVREWRPVWADPEKSRAYAVQWFSFAAIAVFLFVFLNLRKLDE